MNISEIEFGKISPFHCSICNELITIKDWDENKLIEEYLKKGEKIHKDCMPTYIAPYPKAPQLIP